MQQAGNADLAAALAPGQKRYFGVKLMVDWARNNLYADALSDMSAYFDSGSIDRQLAGVIPSEMQTTEGFSTAKLTMQLSGDLPDGTPLWKVFSPYSGYGAYGTGGAVDIPVYLQVVTLTAVGIVATDQFTGWIDSAVPDRVTGAVTMTCFDGGGKLEIAQTMDLWACDAYRRESIIDSASANSQEALESGTGTMSWLIDALLRRAGFYEGPNLHSLCILGWTLNGSTLPEIGTIAGIPPTIYGNVWGAGGGIGDESVPMRSPAMLRPAECYSPGKYGYAFKGKNGIGTWKTTGLRYLTNLRGGAMAKERYEPQGYGGLNSNLLGSTMWVYIDRANPNQYCFSQFYLSPLIRDYSGATQYPANVLIEANTGTGICRMIVTNEGSTKSWTWTTAALATGWHFLSWVTIFTPGQVSGSLWLDGVLTLNSTNGGTAGGLGTIAYPWIQGQTNSARVYAEGRMQYVQWVAQRNAVIGSYLQPAMDPPPRPRETAKVDLSGQRMLWVPNIENDPAGDPLQAAVGADLGALYFTEQGVATFDNRATIKGRQLVANVMYDLTIDQMTNVAPLSTYASVANKIGYTAKFRTAGPYQTIYASSQAGQFLLQPSTVARPFPTSLTDVMQIRMGDATWRPFAQGYDSGLTPPTLYWQSYMDYYKPDYWDEGWTSYTPNSRSPSNPPPLGPSAAAAICMGWFDYDYGNRRARLVLSNFSGSQLVEFAVDDSTAFLKFGGSLILDRPVVVEAATDGTSIARYRERIYNLPADDYHQDLQWLRDLAGNLLADVKQPQTSFESVEVPGDPRRQLQDVVRIVDPDRPGQPGMTGATVAYGSVVGIVRNITGGESGAKLTDTLTIRTFPG
jgi:hypothetical protein